MLRSIASEGEAHDEAIWSTAWVNEDQLATGSMDESVKIWNCSSKPSTEEAGKDGSAAELAAPLQWEVQRTMEGHMLGVLSVVPAPDGSVLSVTSMDSHWRVWDARSGLQHKEVDAGEGGVECWTASHHPTKPLLAVGSQSGRVHFWDREEERKTGSVSTQGGFVMDVAFDPSGSRVASVSQDGWLNLFDVESGTILSRVEAHARPIRSLAFSPSGRQLYTASDDGRINVFDTGSSSPNSVSLTQSLAGHAGWVLSVTASSDDTHVASGSADGTVRLWDVRRRECLHSAEPEGGPVWSTAFHPDGARVAAATEAGSLHLYRWG